MPVTEVLMGLGSWGVSLTEETPREVLDRLQYFGHVAFIAGRLSPAEYGDNLLSTARYVGVVTKRETEQAAKVGGQGMAVWLGDADDKGEVLESAVVITGQTFANAVRQILGASTAVVEGTFHSGVAGTYTGRHQWQSKRKAIDRIAQLMGGEWRVNGNATLDVGPASALFSATPSCVILRQGAVGRDLDLTGLPGDMALTRDVEDWTTRVVVLAEGEGESTATGSANIASNPYLDLRGQPVLRTRLVSESTTSAGNADASAQLQLNRFSGTRNALRLSTTDYELRSVSDDVRGSVEPGDWVWVWDPDSGLFDISAEVTFRGERLNPIKLRVVETSWPVGEGMTVAYRHQDGTWVDLTPYVRWESGATTVTVGELSRSLTNAGTEPVGPRPIPDSTIPGVVSWDLPFTTGVYLDVAGNSRARMIVAWDLPLNSDGSTILDGDHYEVQYGLSPATNWQTTYAPWGTLQAEVLDLSPGVDYDFRIRAVDTSGNQGAWSAVETATANPDTIPPSTPAPPTVAGSRLAIQITHTLGKASGGTFNLELDLDHLEVHVGASSGFTPDSTTLKGKVAANSGMINGLIPAVGTVEVEETTVRHVKVIAVDLAGNRSAASASATATALLIDSAHISDLIASKITAGTLSANIILGAAIHTAASGQRVELNQTGLHGFNGSGSELVSLLNTGAFSLRSAISGARVELDGTNGFRAFNSGGTQTVALSTTGAFTLQTGTSGARLQLDANGLRAYNSSNQQTVDIASASGNVTLVGQLSTGFSGKRIVFNPAGSASPEIRFYATSGSEVATITSTSNTTDYVGIFQRTSTYSDMFSVFELYPDVIRLNHTGDVGGFAGALIEMSPVEVLLQCMNSGGTATQFRVTPTGVTINGVSHKSFIIPHTDDPDRYLIHGCTESPHNGVEYWGEADLDGQGAAVVELPGYFEPLTTIEGRSVLVTPVGTAARAVSATTPRSGRFTIHGTPGQRVSWLVKAIRRDVPPLLVEPRRDQVNVYGDGPYRYYTLKEPRG
ncbi:fibronectin type III domain-containing protein [Nonomuraea sp. NPDC050310]|uniref:fibronectin type III domain-containing protein n=1 Tax=Nonomuraea sp. NPDC050310 TaxID=3154935 RepID=UPI0033F9E0FE